MLNAMPTTVTGNVKNVVGWRGGAERGFHSVYSDCIHVIRTEGAKFLSPDLTSKYMKVGEIDTIQLGNSQLLNSFFITKLFSKINMIYICGRKEHRLILCEGF